MSKKSALIKKRIRLRNKKLVKRFPWLQPRNVWSGLPLHRYNYSFTWLDDLDRGWRKAFGMMMIEEVDELLRSAHYEREYQIVQIKEKYAALRWYDNGAPTSIYEQLNNVIDKYSHLSENICGHCGKPDVYVTYTGWDYPLCQKCYEKNISDTRKYEDVISKDDPGRMADSYFINRWDQGKKTQITYDIRDTAERIRKNYERSIRRFQRKRRKATSTS